MSYKVSYILMSLILMSLTNILLLMALYFANKSIDYCDKTLKHEMNKLKSK